MPTRSQTSGGSPDVESIGFFRQFWNDHKRAIVIVAVIVILGVIGIGIAIRNGDDSSSSNSSSHVDLTDLSRFYDNNIHSQVDPCNNFYTYACSRLIDTYKREHLLKFDTRDSMVSTALSLLAKLFSRKIADSDSLVLKRLKSFYAVCMNSTKIATEGKESLLQLLQDVGGWPLLLDGSIKWNKTDDWIEVLGRLNRAGFESMFPFRLEFEGDPEDSTKLAMVLGPVIDTRYESEPESKTAIDYMMIVAQSLGSMNPRLFDDVADCVVFGKRLFMIANSPQTSIRYSIVDLSTKYPEFSWDLLFNATFTATSVKISKSNIVIVDKASYISRVSILINETPVDTVINYMVWRMLDAAINFTHLEPHKPCDGFRLPNTSITREKTCMKVLIDRASSATGIVYLQNIFDPLVRKEVQVITDNIKSQAFGYLNESTWMNDDLKKSMIENLMSVETIIAHADGDINFESAEKLLRNWDFRHDETTLENYRSLLKFHRINKLHRLKMSQKEDLSLTILEKSTTSNGVFMPSTNAIYIYAGLLQAPYFRLEQPKYLNYGGAGLVVAHEFTHGMQILTDCECDNKTCPDCVKFEKQKDCVQKLYDNYEVQQIKKKVNGTHTLEENFADLLGLKFAYDAYNTLITTHELADPALAGLNYTAQQMFWINSAMTHCTYLDDEALAYVVKTEEHSPPEARVNVAFGNSYEFLRDFGCRDDSKMNFKEKCKF